MSRAAAWRWPGGWRRACSHATCTRRRTTWTSISCSSRSALADYTIVFAKGRMVLAYLATDPMTRGIAAAGDFSPPDVDPESRCRLVPDPARARSPYCGLASVSRSFRIPLAHDLPVGADVLQRAESRRICCWSTTRFFPPSAARTRRMDRRWAGTTTSSSSTSTARRRRRRAIRRIDMSPCPTASICRPPATTATTRKRQ